MTRGPMANRIVLTTVASTLRRAGLHAWARRAQAGNLADQLARRYRLRRHALSLLQPITLCARLIGGSTHTTHSQSQHHQHLHWSPNLNLTIVRRAERAPAVRSESEVHLDARRRAGAALPSAGDEAETIARRVVVRHRRRELSREEIVHMDAPSRGRGEDPPVALSERPIVRRSRAIPSPDADEPPRTRAAPRPPAPPTATLAPSSATPFATADVRALTDRILQDIDRRIVAQRERFGRA
jgi:hypothetical protein